MTSSDFGYKFLERAMRENQQRDDARRVDERFQRYIDQTPQRPRRQGPLQNQIQDLDRGAAPSSAQYRSTADFIRASMLPGVYELVGEAGVYGADNEARGRRNREDRAEQRRQEEVRGTARAVDAPNLRVGTSPVRVMQEYLGTGYDVAQPAITGLNEQLESNFPADRAVVDANVIADFDRVIQQYPELLPLVMDDNQNIGRVSEPIRGGAFEPYVKYTDFTQTYSDPDSRAALYADLVNQPMTPELERNIRNEMGLEGQAEPRTAMVKLLEMAESDYISGDPTLQSYARDVVDLLGGGEKLRSMEVNAFQTRRPVVGGGGYTNIEYDDDAKYINRRAKDFNDAVSRVQREFAMPTLQRKYPGMVKMEQDIRGGVSRIPDQMTFFVEDDGSVRTDAGSFYSDGNDMGYNVSVQRGYPQLELQAVEGLGGQKVSKNVLKFLRDNPAFTQTGLSFQTGKPGEGPSFEYVELPPELVRPVADFMNTGFFSNRRGGTLLSNSPMGNIDIIQEKELLGNDETTSSYLRREKQFADRGSDQPNIRGQAYAAQGFGPYSPGAGQYAYVDRSGQIIPLQPFPPERPLVGKVTMTPGSPSGATRSLPAATFKSQPRFYSTLAPGVTPEGLRFAFDRIRTVPSSLLPGVADLIPTSTAVSRAYNEGAGAGAQQVAQDFVTGLPVSAALAPVLSSPVVAPLAPGIGAGLLTTAGGEAVNELVKQQTGKSLAQRVQETAGALSRDTSLVGTPNRSFARDSNQGRARAARELDRVNNPPQITQGEIRSDNTGIDRSGENFLQRRLRLAREARQQDPGDFGITELIFGR